MKLSIIIPAYNEEDRIIHTLDASLAFLNQQNFHSEIIVVSDGSTDHTRSVVEGFDSGNKVDLRVIEYHPNRGKGYAVRTGMLAGNGEMILFMDADYAVPIEEITKGMDLIESGFDVAMGSRAVVRRRGRGPSEFFPGAFRQTLQPDSDGISGDFLQRHPVRIQNVYKNRCPAAFWPAETEQRDL